MEERIDCLSDEKDDKYDYVGNYDELIKHEINAYIKTKPNLKPFEKISKFEILKNSFNQEEGLMTQSGKMKRNKVYDRYKSIISKMFQDKK